MSAKAPFNVYSQFLNEARKNNTEVAVSLLDETEIVGLVKSFDDVCFILAPSEPDSKPMMIFRHAVAYIE